MEIREMQSLVLLGRTRSILHTSEMLHLTPGAVHKHLKTLEAELGVRLYEKHAGTLRLTPEGKLVLPFFEQAIEAREAARQAVADSRNGPSGLVRVGAGPSFSSYMLPGILRRFRSHYRPAEVYVETGNGDHLLESLRSGSLDLIFDPLSGGESGSDLRVTASWDAEIGIVSARPELTAHMKISQMRNVPFILFQHNSRMDALVQGHFERIGFQPAVVMRSDSSEAIKAMVKARLGVAMLFLWNANPELQNGSLRVIRTDAPPLHARMALLRRSLVYVPGAQSAFIEIARSMRWKNLHPVN